MCFVVSKGKIFIINGAGVPTLAVNFNSYQFDGV
jgi:hypothetical protein